MGDAAEGVKLFVGNLTYNTSEREVEDLFVKYGTVKEVHIAVDRASGSSRGFAFVTMSDARDADDAVAGLVDKEIDGRVIRVEKAGASGGGRRDGGGRGGGGRSDACFDFQRGRCTRGSSCKFSHEDGGDSRGGGGGGRDDYHRRDDRRDDRGGGGYGRDDRGGGGYSRDSGRDDRGGGRSRDSGRDRDRSRDRERSRDRGYDRR